MSQPNGAPQPPSPASGRGPEPGINLSIGACGDAVIIQLTSTITLDADSARGLARQIAEAADKAATAIVVTGAMPGKIHLPGR